MIKLTKLILLVTGLLMSQHVLASSKIFSADVLTQLKQNYQGKRWLMLMWSVDCPPCMKELGAIQSLRKEQPNLNVVIVNTDANAETMLQAENILAQFDVSDLTHYYFADGQSDQSRYAIDPSWYGELPRSYFIDESGNLYGKSGLIAKELLSRWLLKKQS
ncbi:redoxin domain-containing protein [Litorilituus sediminis]|uniref:Redoxin domain-containing protein n=2 Tax=Litorilituus sediminis TaxID=718192 RepID=A0A4P6P3G0_9GAMM|nr:redoxin domain-containing protein [Litorilituus sediminis]